MDLPKRKPNRLRGYDYDRPGAYFITFCTQNRRCVLSRIVGGGAHDAPRVELTELGKIVDKYIRSGNRMEHISVDKYVIMPNHVHILLSVTGTDCERAPNGTSRAPCGTSRAPCGTSRAPSPTNQLVPRFVSTLKRFCHAEMGQKLFQRSFHDHVIRNEADYREIWQYIDGNPGKWEEDKFYIVM